MENSAPTQPSQSAPRSFWVVWTAWLLVAGVLVWSFGIDFFLSELKMLSFWHMIIWALMLLVSFVLFLVGFIGAIGDLARARKSGEMAFRNKYIGRIILSGMGVFGSPVLIFIYGLMVLTVGNNL